MRGGRPAVFGERACDDQGYNSKIKVLHGFALAASDGYMLVVNERIGAPFDPRSAPNVGRSSDRLSMWMHVDGRRKNRPLRPKRYWC